MSNEPFMIKVPGSTANLGPGFDSIGLAVNRFLTLEVIPADEWKFSSASKELAGIPEGEDNLVCEVAMHIAADQGKTIPPCHVTMTSDIPLARGLGSSAAAIVAGIELANQLLGEPLTAEEKVRYASLWEVHADNVAASVYGGLTIGTHSEDRTFVIEGGVPSLDLIVLVPTKELKTTESRGVLPESLSYAEAIKGSGIANVLVAAVLQGNWEIAGKMMSEDIFHHPYRGELIPHLADVMNVANEETEAYGVALSGAGPTILCIAPDGQGESIQKILQQRFPELQADILKPASEGVVVKKGKEATVHIG